MKLGLGLSLTKSNVVQGFPNALSLNFDGTNAYVDTGFQPDFIHANATMSYWVRLNDFVGMQVMGCHNGKRFYLGFNTTNETGAWLSLTDGKLAYNKAVVSKLHGYVEDPYDEDEHLACRNFPNCNEVGCGEW